MNKFIEVIVEAFACTICVMIFVIILLCIFNGKNEVFVTMFSFGAGLILTMFLCTFLILKKLK